MRVRTIPISPAVFLTVAGCLAPAAYCQDRIVIDDKFPGAYQVEVADVNGDRRPDVIAVGGNTCAWYENPTWKKRIVSTGKQTPGIISSATADLDGDGKAEIAIAYEFEMNRPTIGKLLMASQGKGPDDPWTMTPIADVDSIHRLRWGDLEGDGRLDLVVAPIFGRNARPPDYADPARLQVFSNRDDPEHKKWTGTVVGTRPVIHAIEVIDATGDGRPDILAASNAGVNLFRLGKDPVSLTTGAAGSPPKRGSSEVHFGHLKDGIHFLATVEPWHGSEVTVSYEESPWPKVIDENRVSRFTPRIVIDNTLADGHALWVADIDGDRNDEIFAGHRGKDHRVSMYKLDRDRKAWTRTVLDREIAAQDLRGGDLDGDGTPDVVAVGGSTHNVVWYRFRRP